MSIAQRLYEGVDTPDGHVGLITYMRTDSTAIAGVAMGEAQQVIGDRFGERYDAGKGRVYKTKAKGAQEAHESVRPTSFTRDPDSMRAHLKAEELRLYRLIWQRAIASQMAPKELETTTAELVGGPLRAAGLARRGRCSTASPGSTPRAGTTRAEEDASARCPPLAEGEATTRPRGHARPSTSPSPRPATPRRP